MLEGRASIQEYGPGVAAWRAQAFLDEADVEPQKTPTEAPDAAPKPQKPQRPVMLEGRASIQEYVPGVAAWRAQAFLDDSVLYTPDSAAQTPAAASDPPNSPRQIMLDVSAPIPE